MTPDPILGVFYHWLGGLASGSFYVPYRGVKKWSWETYWLVGGIFSWLVCPWVLALWLTEDLYFVLSAQTLSTLGWTYLFGLLWGLGGLTYGLTMRYLGLSLGTGVALGFCAACGTLVPPLLKTFMPQIPVPESLLEIVRSRAGQITLGGVQICLVGIAIAALAGWWKERELSSDQKQAGVLEFNFRRGLAVAIFCGIMSACFAFALTAAEPIAEASRQAGTDPIWSGLPKLVVLLLGGATTNVVWCIALNLRNRTGYQYLARQVRPEHAALKADGGEHGAAAQPTLASNTAGQDLAVPRMRNFLFSALAGSTWYLQFFFYTMGETQMGRFGFASWTLHMASIIIFATMWGWIFHEWKGSSRKVHLLIGAGVATLVLSTVVIGVGAYFKGQSGIGH